MEKELKLKPYFPVSTKIFSKYSYYKFLKNRPKHLVKLEIERYDSISDDIRSLRAMGIHIKNLAKSVKNVQSLNFVEFPHRFIPMNVHKDMIKRFLRIRKLSQFWMQGDSKIIFLNYLYLKKLKNLKSLVLDESDGESFVFTEPESLERITSKFLRFIQKTKLEKLEYKLNDRNAPYYGLLDFSQCPSSLQTWALSCSDSQSIDTMHNIWNLNLSHLQNLRKFQMLTDFSLDLLNQVLSSIMKPGILKVLAFKAINKDILIEEVLPTTRRLLTKFSELEHLTVSSDSWIDLLSYPWKLKSLDVEIQAFRRENLKSLKDFVDQQNATLESLNLKLCFEEQPETFLEEMRELIKLIGELKKLKAVRIFFTIKARPNGDDFRFPRPIITEEEIKPLPILPQLIEAISQLKDLKELGISYVGAEFSKDFEGFFGALEQRSETLEVLEISLKGCVIQKRQLKTLERVLVQCKNLEALKLKSLVSGYDGFFKSFAKIIHRCLNLRSLVLSDIGVGIFKYKPQEMLEDIFRKKNLTHIYFRDAGGESNVNDDSYEKLTLDRIYREYPHIQSLIAPVQTDGYDFPSKWT